MDLCIIQVTGNDSEGSLLVILIRGKVAFVIGNFNFPAAETAFLLSTSLYPVVRWIGSIFVLREIRGFIEMRLAHLWPT